MNRTIASALVAAAILVAGPASADWEKTRWGDPVDKVIAKAGPGIVRTDGTEGQGNIGWDLRAKRRGNLKGIAVDWLFYFGPDGGLSAVRIVALDGANCAAFVSMIRGSLGQPADIQTKIIWSQTNKTVRYDDKPKNLTIWVLDGKHTKSGRPLHCHVTYRPYGDGKPGNLN